METEEKPRYVAQARGMKIRKINVVRKVAGCPRCGAASKRHSIGRRRLRELGITGPTMLDVRYSKHYCEKCRKHFSVDTSFLAPPSGRFTHRVRKTSVDFVRKQGLTIERAVQRMRQRYYVHIPPTTLHDWVVEERDATDILRKT